MSEEPSPSSSDPKSSTLKERVGVYKEIASTIETALKILAMLLPIVGLVILLPYCFAIQAFPSLDLTSSIVLIFFLITSAAAITLVCVLPFLPGIYFYFLKGPIPEEDTPANEIGIKEKKEKQEKEFWIAMRRNGSLFLLNALAALVIFALLIRHHKAYPLLIWIGITALSIALYLGDKCKCRWWCKRPSFLQDKWWPFINAPSEVIGHFGRGLFLFLLPPFFFIVLFSVVLISRQRLESTSPPEFWGIIFACCCLLALFNAGISVQKTTKAMVGTAFVPVVILLLFAGSFWSASILGIWDCGAIPKGRILVKKEFYKPLKWSEAKLAVPNEEPKDDFELDAPIYFSIGTALIVGKSFDKETPSVWDMIGSEPRPFLVVIPKDKITYWERIRSKEKPKQDAPAPAAPATPSPAASTSAPSCQPDKCKPHECSCKTTPSSSAAPHAP